jgi:hypothetical protein
MKKSIITTIIALLLIGAYTNGFAKSNAEKSAVASSVKIKKVITESVKYPDWGYKKGVHGDVDITFTVSEAGMIELKDISCKSDELKDYVKTELTKIILKDIIHPLNQQYKMTLKFNLS